MRVRAWWAATAMAAGLLTAPAEAGERWNDWDNRRDARRAGIIAGTAASEIAASAGRADAREDYVECMREHASNMRYDRYCREEYFKDRQRNRRVARRTGVVVGLTAREIVRQ